MSIENDDLIIDSHPVQPEPPKADEVQPEDAQAEETKVDLIQPVFVPKGKVSGRNALRESDLVGDSYTLPLPSASAATFDGPINETLNAYSETHLNALLQSQWGTSLVIGNEFTYPRDDYNEALDREGSDWKDGVYHDGKKISISRLTPKPRNGALTGMAAMARVASSSKIGQPVNVPLWGTGIWVLISPMSLAEMLNLDAAINNLKASFGRRTRGRLFSLSDIHLKMPLINAILDHAEDTTWISNEKADLKSIIKLTDLQALIWGMACAVFPNGHQYAHACSAAPGKCDYVGKGKVHMPDLFKVDNAALTEKQRKHMLSPTTKIKQEQLDEYQREFVTGGRDEFVIDDKKFILDKPTLADYERAGYRWVSDLEKAYENTFGRDQDPGRRAEHVASMAELASIRQHAHWVKKIVFQTDGEDGDRIEDPDTLISALEQLSGDEKVTAAYYSNVVTYINAASVSMTGIMNFFCPSCKQKQPTDAGPFEHLIPIDMASAFFSLAHLRLSMKLVTSNI